MSPDDRGTSPAPAAAPGASARWPAILTLLLIPIAALGLTLGFRFLSAIENDQESHHRWSRPLGILSLALLIALFLLALALRSIPPEPLTSPLRRAGTSTLWSLAASLLVYFVPFPFLGPILSSIALCVAAGVAIVAAVRFAVVRLRPLLPDAAVEPDRPPPWAGSAAVVLAASGIAVAMLIIKLSSLGWAIAND